MCKNLLNAYYAIRPVENRTNLQTLLVANTIRVKILMIGLLQAAKDAAYFDQKSAAIFADSRRDEEAEVNFTQN